MKNIRYTTILAPPGPPSGLQPLSWLQATGEQQMQDFRGEGYANIIGSMPVSQDYPGGKWCWVFDQSMVKIENLGLENYNGVTILYDVVMPGYGGQQYFCTYGQGTNNNGAQDSFDAYLNNSQIIFRTRSPAGQTNAGGGLMAAAGLRSAGAFTVDYNQARPFSSISPHDSGKSSATDAVTGRNWSAQTLYLFQYTAGEVPMTAQMLIRSELVFGGAMDLWKCAEWLYYINTLP